MRDRGNRGDGEHEHQGEGGFLKHLFSCSFSLFIRHCECKASVNAPVRERENHQELFRIQNSEDLGWEPLVCGAENLDVDYNR